MEGWVEGGMIGWMIGWVDGWSRQEVMHCPHVAFPPIIHASNHPIIQASIHPLCVRRERTGSGCVSEHTKTGGHALLAWHA